MQAILVMFRSDGERRSFSIMRDMTVIGRREDCDLRIPLSDVSRKHCRLVRDGDTLRLEDLGSSNGTYRNGERVQEAILSPGDTLQVGPVQFVLQIDGNPADDDLAPAYASESQAGQSYAATEESTTESSDEPYPLTDHTDAVTVGEPGVAARELSEHATIEEPTPVAAPAAPRVADAAPARKKSNGVHAAPPTPPPAPPAAETDVAPPFQGLDELEDQSAEQDFFILDEPSSSSQSGEVQIDLDSPQA